MARAEERVGEESRWYRMSTGGRPRKKDRGIESGHAENVRDSERRFEFTVRIEVGIRGWSNCGSHYCNAT